MPSPTERVKPSSLSPERLALVIVVALLGVAACLAALVPASSLEAAAARMGHSDDFSAERVERFRRVAGAMGLAHLLGAAWLVWALGQSSDERSHPAASGARDEPEPKRGLLDWLTQPGKAHAFAVAGVLACATGVRVSFINVPMDYDEAYSFLNYARRPLYQALSDYNSTNNHLLNTLGMHVAYRMFGQEDWALRLHVLLAGVLLIGATYAFARRVFGPDVALVAAAWAAVSDVLVNYSVNARGYVLLAWATIELLHRFWRLTEVDSRDSRSDWIVAWVAAAAGIFALPMMVYPIAGCAAFFVCSSRRWDKLSGRLVALCSWLWLVALAAGWVYGPGLVLRGVDPWRHPFVQPRQWGQWTDWLDWLECTPGAWLLAARTWAEGPIVWWAVLGFAVVGVGVSVRRGVLASSVLLVIPAASLAIMALQLISPPPRVFSFLAPVFAVSAGVGSLAMLGWCVRAATLAFSRQPVATEYLAIGLASAILASGVWKTAHSRLPGGDQPTFLVQHVAKGESLWVRPDDHLWRLSVPAAVRRLDGEADSNVRVLVGLPADLPFHYYVAKQHSSLLVGGPPRVGEHVFLVIRPDARPAEALAHDTSLLITDWRVLEAKWRLVAELDHLSIYEARVAP